MGLQNILDNECLDCLDNLSGDFKQEHRYSILRECLNYPIAIIDMSKKQLENFQLNLEEQYNG